MLRKDFDSDQYNKKAPSGVGGRFDGIQIDKVN